MMRFICLVFCVVLVGCDSFPGPVLRSEFPTEIKVSIVYSDGHTYSESWPSCRTVTIGASEIGRFGMRAKDVSVNEITIEQGSKVIHHFDKAAISSLTAKAKEQGYPIWVLDSSGVRFSNDKKCSLADAD